MTKTFQLQGPFEANQELIQGITNIMKIGIFSKPNHSIHINGMEFEIGQTGILEIEGTHIESLSFDQDEEADTYIDFMML